MATENIAIDFIGTTIQGLYALLTNVIFMAIILTAILIVAYVILTFNRFRKSATVIFVGSKREIRSYNIPIPDLQGFVIKYGNNVLTYNLSKAEPLLIRKFWGVQPLYFITQDTPEGLDFDVDTGTIEPQYHPKVLNKMVDSEFFKSVATASTNVGKIDLLQILIGIAVGVAIIMVLNTAKILPLCS